MHRFFAFVLATLVFLPATAHAQTALAPRFDLMVGFLGGAAQNSRVSAVSLSPVLKLDAGLQLGDHAALFARVEGGTMFLTSEGAAYLLAEWTPVPAISVGTGIGYDGMSIFWGIGAGCEYSSGPCARNSWSGVSVPLTLAWNIQSRRDASGESNHHGRLRLEIEGAAGYEPGTETWGVHGSVAVGWSWM